MNNKDLNLPHLVQVCEAATPGTWELDDNDGTNCGRIYSTGSLLAQIVGDSAESVRNGEFISTFDPSTVLALLRRLMEAEERVRELERLNTPSAALAYQESVHAQERKAPCRHGDFDTPLDEGAKD